MGWSSNDPVRSAADWLKLGEATKPEVILALKMLRRNLEFVEMIFNHETTEEQDANIQMLYREVEHRLEDIRDN